MKASFRGTVKLIPAVLILIGFIVLTLHYFDGEYVWNSFIKLFHHPFLLIGIFSVYLLSFCFKAIAWKLYLQGRARFSTCLLGILYSLFVNHLIPIKIGDLVRMKILSMRDCHIKNEEAIHSVIVLRMLDMISLIGITLIGLLSLKVRFVMPFWMIILGIVICSFTLLVMKKYAREFLKRHISLFKHAFSGKNGFVIILMTFMSWTLEAGVLYFTVIALSGDLSFLEAVFANSVTIAGQVFQITPGGIANYESFLVFALSVVGFTMKDGYTIAVLTHAIKFSFSYLAGAVAFIIYPISLKTVKEWIKVRGVTGK
ncbi:lysylphosphatidylglycerol synthase transmembrane domain-containing protein [Peribacillus asahii]|uniref:lysylphosphatidylglycerol synthase transmembrane domain-containing protein n=1 Tax=Peribacillus asahii TaxID=228899 RepID=UPI00381C9728